MNWIKKCPAFFLLALSGLLFTLIGMTGRFSVYKDYEFDIVKKPFLALMMEGAGKGIAPWEAAGSIGLEEDEFPGGLLVLFRDDRIGQSIGYLKEEDALESFAEESAVDGTEGDLGAEEHLDIAAAGDGTAGNGAKNNGIEGNRASDHGAGEGGIQGGGTEGVQDSAAVTDGGTASEKDGRTYEFRTVTEDYFNDAVFIGDSRTVGLFEYGGIEERADFYAKISLTIYNVFTELLAKDEETGKKITVEEALAQKQYGKVYLMLGINELGTGTTETFIKEYQAVVERIRQLQPDAVIFVEGIMKVTGSKDETDPVFNNKNIEEKNMAIAGLADNQDIFYIDVNEAVCDAEGNLNAEYTIDEVHLKAKYYEIWKQFLLEHGIER